MYFPQIHRPGVQAQSDFTDMRRLEIRIGGELFPHLLYHFVLTYSNWEAVSVCPSESFESLSAGLQGALWRLGGVPLEHRTDNLSAATHELVDSRGRDFTVRYRELLEHYGLRASRNFPGNAHENGDVESVNGGLKTAIDQRLRLRGSRDFASREAYQGFIEACVVARNATRTTWIEEERSHLRPLPLRALPSYRELYATVSRSSIVRIVNRAYSVSSRLRGCRLRVRLHADLIELEYRGEQVAAMDRLVGHAVRLPGAGGGPGAECGGEHLPGVDRGQRGRAAVPGGGRPRVVGQSERHGVDQSRLGRFLAATSNVQRVRCRSARRGQGG